MATLQDFKKSMKVSIKVGKGTFQGRVSGKTATKVEVTYKNTKGELVTASRGPELVTIL